MKYDEYIAYVESGKIATGREMKLAVRHFHDMMNNPDYYFDAKAVKWVADCISSLRHYTGKHAGNRFILEPWQNFIIASVYGFKYKSNNLRVVRSVYLEMARKQGKSALASGLGLYHFIFDREMNAEVYLAANSKDQARIAFTMCKNFALTLDPKEQMLRPMRDAIEFKRMLSILRVLASDDTKLDGFNASMFLLDEYHAAKDTRLKDVLQSSQGMREQPMKIIITTAGFDKLSPCYEYRTMCEEVLSGAKKDDTLFSAIYSLDEGDNWKDPSVWIKSNPNLGVTVSPEYIHEQITLAENSPSEEVGVKTKNLNLWCDASEVWIPDHYILDATREVPWEEFKDCDLVYGGIDLSSTTDLTAVAAMGVKDDRYIFRVHYFLPEESLSENRFKIRYAEWRKNGWLTITPGNVTDYDFILNLLTSLDGDIMFQKIGYDAWNSTQFVISATDAGLPMRPYSQALGNFNKPTKEMERLILSGKVSIDNNGITRHCFRNVQMVLDKNGNTKPSKQFAEKKIDGVIAMIEALGMYLENPMNGSTEL